MLLVVAHLALHSFSQDVSMALQQPPRLSPAEQRAKWNQVSETTVVSFATAGVRLFSHIPPAVSPYKTWKASAWKNEKVHTQIVAYTKVALEKLTVTAGDLTDDRGNRISSEYIQTGFVQYVMTDEFRNGCGYRKPKDFDSSLVADIIHTGLSSVPVSKHTTQPVWLSIKVPADARAGTYTGTVTVNAGSAYTLQVVLTVIDKILPHPRDWSFRLDYWQHPAAISRVHNVPLWSNQHFNLMREYYTMLADAGQKIITASIVDEPWGHQTYDDYPSLIHWTKKKDGNWVFDYSLFDKYISFVMSCGITERINCYSMVPWKVAFRYYDEAMGKDTVFTGAIGTPEYNAFWRTMLVDFTAHLKKKGWFEMTTIAMDERPMQAMVAVIELLKSIDPNWKISLAGDYHPEIEKDIYDYCVASRWVFPDSVLQKRKQSGKVSTWYTCCTEKYPNMFTFSPPDEAVWTGWYTAATRMDGFLRWAYNSWPATPLADSRFTAWPAGDTYQVYPGPLSSIRFEKLIEGIQDFEKITQLRRLYTNASDSLKLERLEQALKGFTIEKLAEQSAQEMLEKVKHLLNE